MSGILEAIYNELQQINNRLAQGMGPAVQPPVQQLGGGSPMQLQPPATVTTDQIVALIQPYIENPQIKAALGAAMRGMGINGLPEAQPHQYAALYAAFQQVIAQAQAAPPQQAPTSII